MSKAPVWIVQTSFVGDCVLSLPFLHELGRLTDAPLVIVAQPGIQKALFELALERGLSHLAPRARVVTLDKKTSEKSFWGLRRWTQTLVESQGVPERVFCLQRSFRSGLVSVLSGCEERVGFSSGAAAFLYTRSVRRSWENGQHEIEKNLDLLRAAFPDSQVDPWRGPDKASLLARTQGRPQRAGDRAALALGSPWPTKRWPVEHAVELCREWTRQGLEVLLIGDPSARDLSAAITAQVPSLLLKDHVGRSNMHEWVDLLDSCAVLVSGDSASVHVASDLALPVVALFGPTVPDFGFAPWRTHSKLLQNADLHCRPCSIHGPKQCPLGHHKCLKDIGAERVAEATKPYLLMDPTAKRL